MECSNIYDNSRYEIAGATPEQQHAVDELAESFTLSDSLEQKLVDVFQEHMDEGLAKNNQNIKMIPSYVVGRPTGKEKGSFYAVDLGGTNLRVLKATLDGHGGITSEHQKFPLTEEAKSTSLFEFIASSIGVFMEERNLTPKPGEPPIPIGFTFSYPINQTALDSGTLIEWTKGLTVPGCVGRDVVRLLQDALLRQHIRVKVVALVNDTVGTLLASAYHNPDSQVGVILGTGTNAAYYERMENIKKWTKKADPNEEMVINMEWGAFDEGYHYLPATMHDIKLDRKSPNPGKQAFEKMISGLYLGEIARNCILHLVDRRLLFGGRSSSILNEMWALDTMYLTEVIKDDSPELDTVRDVIEKTLDVPGSNLVERRIVKAIALMIGKRSADLSAVGLSAVLLKRPELLDSSITVGIDGSMYEFFPGFKDEMLNTMSKFMNRSQMNNINLTLAKDGSGVGAAVIAMMAVKHEN